MMPSLGFIGIGKVGTTLATHWARSGYQIRAIYSRTRTDHAAALAAQTGAMLADTPQAVVTHCDLTLLTVPDAAIYPLAEALAQALMPQPDEWRQKAIIHTSGAHSREALKPLAALTLMTGSLHPAFPFTAPDQPLIAGAAFALEAEDATLHAWLSGLVHAVDGHALTITTEHKPLYHAALAIASNYTVTLYAAAERLLQHTGADAQTTAHILQPLMQATLANLTQRGIPDALTGALVRNDLGTIQAHLEALQTTSPTTLDAYRALARLSYPVLEARGLPTSDIEALLDPTLNPTFLQVSHPNQD